MRSGQELVRDVEVRPGCAYRFAAPPSWVRSLADWRLWVMEYRYGVLAAEHRRLSERLERLEEERRASDPGDEELSLSLHLETIKAGEALARFLLEYLRPSEPPRP